MCIDSSMVLKEIDWICNWLIGKEIDWKEVKVEVMRNVKELCVCIVSQWWNNWMLERRYIETKSISGHCGLLCIVRYWWCSFNIFLWVIMIGLEEKNSSPMPNGRSGDAKFIFHYLVELGSNSQIAKVVIASHTKTTPLCPFEYM